MRKAMAGWLLLLLCIALLLPAGAETRQAVIAIEGMEEPIEETLFTNPQGFSFWYPADRLEVYNGSIGVTEGAIVTVLYTDDSMILSMITEEDAVEYAEDSGRDIMTESAASRVQMDVYRETEEGRIYFLTVVAENGKYLSAVGEYSLEAAEGNAKYLARVLDTVVFGEFSEGGTTEREGYPDASLTERVSGEWTEKDADEGYEMSLNLDMNGSMTLRFNALDGSAAYTYLGTWVIRFIPDYGGRMTMVFTSTDNPARAGIDYREECVYDAYTESWIENDKKITFLIMTPPMNNGSISPFEDILGYDDVALRREKGPTMRVVNCREFVSLRDSRDTKSRRLAKVPLGTELLGLPEEGQQKGFIHCVYKGRDGYILAEYLEPIE